MVSELERQEKGLKSVQFVIKKSPVDYLYLWVDPANGVTWVRDHEQANKYPSRYAAKKHMNKLDNLSETATVFQVR